MLNFLQITDYDNFNIADESFDIPPSDILNNSAKTIFAKALEFRNDIKFSKSTVDLAEKDLEIAKGAYAPTLAGFFNMGQDIRMLPSLCLTGMEEFLHLVS